MKLDSYSGYSLGPCWSPCGLGGLDSFRETSPRRNPMHSTSNNRYSKRFRTTSEAAFGQP